MSDTPPLRIGAQVFKRSPIFFIPIGCYDPKTEALQPPWGPNPNIKEHWPI